MPSIELIVSIISACIFAAIAILQAFASRRKDKLAITKLGYDVNAAKTLADTNTVTLAGVLASMLVGMEQRLVSALQAHAKSDEENIAKVYTQLEEIKFKLPS